MQRDSDIKTDVLVVGAGLAGAATAYFLAKEGIDVLVVDKFGLNTQASGSNAGSIHIQIPHHEFTTEGCSWVRGFAPIIPVLLDAAKLWARIGDEIKCDLEVSISGGLLVAHTEQQMRDIRRKSKIERDNGAGTIMLGGGEVREIAPYVSRHAVGGAFCPYEGKANPLKATPGFAAAAARKGARIMQNTEVLAMEERSNFILARTPAGIVRAGRVVNCAGADAGRVARMVGVNLPIECYPIQASVTEPAQPFIPHLVYAAGNRLTLKQMRNGTILIGGGWSAERRKSDGRLAVDPHSLSRNMQVALGVVPSLANLQVVRCWPAYVNGTADWNPILGQVPNHPRFYINMFPWMGFTAAPLAALAVAERVIGRKPSLDLDRFSALRYMK